MQDSIDNEDILTLCHGLCMCGCGTVIPLRDGRGRFRTYVNGHNRRKVKDPILIEVLKIKDIQTAKDIIHTQAKIISYYEQRLTRFEDSFTKDQYPGYFEKVT